MKKQQFQYELWQSCYDWLCSMGQSVNRKFCKDQITAHPDYPALTALADFLDQGHLAYTAAKADASYINEMNYPLLAHIKQPGQEYMYPINNAAEWDAQKDITKHWSGVVLYADKESRWQSEENEQFKKQESRKAFYLLATFIMLAALIFTAIINQPIFSYAVFGITALIGLLLSLLISGSEIGVQSNIVKQVCGVVSKNGCDAVLKTKYAKGIVGFSMGDIATVYFGTQLISFLLAGINPSMYNIAYWLSLPGIAVAGWSIYTQARIIKRWCALCLGLVAILVVQFTIAAFSIKQLTLAMPNGLSIFLFMAIGAMLLFLLWPLKALLKKQQVQTTQLAELKKWKMDAGLFITQWEQERKVDTGIWENDLIIGNPQAPVMITVACNPYCMPCANAHKQLDELVEKNKERICVQVRFLCNPNNANDKRTIAVTAILQKAGELKSPDQVAGMLTDWFKWMNLEKWMQHWKPVTPTDVSSLLQQHAHWTEQSAITYTPTFFVNGKQLPGRYGLVELDRLLPQLAEDLENDIKINS